jgi:hypothetical protein
VPYQAGLGEWIELPDSWVRNAHRAGAVGAGMKMMNGTEGDSE